MGSPRTTIEIEVTNGSGAKDSTSIEQEAGEVLRQEADALRLAANRILSESSSASYKESVLYLDAALRAGGKIIFTGVGKSGIIATKISATLTSVGIPSTFMHPSDGQHGDLGSVEGSDAVVVISYSGNTEECIKILPYIKCRGVKIIAICGNEFSRLIDECDAWIDASVEREADPNIPIPTTSSTLALALGDAISVNLIRLRKLTLADFQANHPGGSLAMEIVYLGNNVNISNNLPFILIAGPCQIETLEHALMMASELKSITTRLNIPFIYKSSFDKANRTSVAGSRGAGVIRGLEILAKVKEEIGCLVTTDVHTEEQCVLAAKVVDVLQIPAFLCRQTDLLAAAAQTGKPVNVKKGQFLSPHEMSSVVQKLKSFNCKNILVCERGTCFGYNNLVSDMRSLAIMAANNVPVIFDATHSVQQPGGLGNASNGQRQFVEVLSRAAISVGVAGLFLEVHQDPDNAPSDGPCMVKLHELEEFLEKLKKYDQVTKSYSGV